MKRSEANDYKTIWISKTVGLRLCTMASLKSTVERKVTQSELANRWLDDALKKEENKIK